MNIAKRQFITDNYQHMTVKEIAETLNCSEVSVRWYVSRYRLTNKKHHRWTIEDDRMVAEMYIPYDTRCYNRIAKKMNTTRVAATKRKDFLVKKYGKNWRNILQQL